MIYIDTYTKVHMFIHTHSLSVTKKKMCLETKAKPKIKYANVLSPFCFILIFLGINFKKLSHTNSIDN